MLTVEQFAALRAQMEGGRPRDEVLRGAGLDPRAWIQAQRHWLAELARARPGRQAELASRYRAAFERASPDATASTVAPTTLADEAARESGGPPAEPVVAAAPVMPTYLRAAALRSAASAALPAPVAPAPEVPPPVPPAPPAPVARVPLAQRGTAPVSAMQAIPIVPFRGGVETPPGRAVQRVADEPVAPRPARTGTALGTHLSRAALTGTALASDAGASASVPFGKSSRPSTPLPEGVPAMSLEQYAWLSATVKTTSASDLPAVLTRMRLTETTRGLLDGYWRDRFAADPALRQAFMPLFAKYASRGS